MLLVGAIVLAVFVLPPGLGALAIALGIAVEVAELFFWVRFLRRYRVQTGVEALVGSSAEVVEALEPRGRVRLRGEIWHARASRRAGIGGRVRVTGVDGLTLEVEPED
ncbi:MAG: NfeD family protein [Solirubrobacterales bacterium]